MRRIGMSVSHRRGGGAIGGTHGRGWMGKPAQKLHLIVAAAFGWHQVEDLTS